MAKKVSKSFTVAKADLKNYSRSEQRRFLDLGLVEGVEAPAVEAEAKAAPKK